mmetsp:Transcript_120935/g.367739  ORF Transcript_120935/g.367739 Transcript_120935/m.367739 type:complete len:290 (+) Transcript_120935:45-914(+)
MPNATYHAAMLSAPRGLAAWPCQHSIHERAPSQELGRDVREKARDGAVDLQVGHGLAVFVQLFAPGRAQEVELGRPACLGGPQLEDQLLALLVPRREVPLHPAALAPHLRLPAEQAVDALAELLHVLLRRLLEALQLPHGLLLQEVAGRSRAASVVGAAGRPLRGLRAGKRRPQRGTLPRQASQRQAVRRTSCAARCRPRLGPARAAHEVQDLCGAAVKVAQSASTPCGSRNVHVSPLELSGQPLLRALEVAVGAEELRVHLLQPAGLGLCVREALLVPAEGLELRRGP